MNKASQNTINDLSQIVENSGPHTTKVRVDLEDFPPCMFGKALLRMTTLQTCTQLPEDELTLQLSFGSRPCPQECDVLAEPICNFTNTLLKSNNLDPSKFSLTLLTSGST
ncbi:hypothetical protein ACHAW6_010827 [Cyclotella cf. meneghiniana]